MPGRETVSYRPAIPANLLELDGEVPLPINKIILVYK
jgi:hypothetical protein